MTEHESIDYNPLGIETDNIVKKGDFAAVLARAGVGKTSFLVQVALSCMLKQKKVLHVSLHDSVKKVSLWYKEIFTNLLHQHVIDLPVGSLDSLLPCRFIMTFKVDRFGLPGFVERFSDITEQGIFVPDVLIIDGLPLNETTDKLLKEIKAFAVQNSLSVWFAGHIHRDEEPSADGTPAPFFHVADNFDVVIQLQPTGERIRVDFIKGITNDSESPMIHVDPSSMLIMES
jgi:hypothetical protein